MKKILGLVLVLFVMQIKGGYCQEIVGYANQPVITQTEVVEIKYFPVETRRLVPVVSYYQVPVVVQPVQPVVYYAPVYYQPQPVVYGYPVVMQKKSCLWGIVRY